MESPSLHDDLKAEYTIIQGQYEQFDQRALTLKALATPLLAGGLGVAYDNHSTVVAVAVTVLAFSVWLLEVIWKSFQYSYIERIKLLEGWFRTGAPPEIQPFQIFSAWSAAFTTHWSDLRMMFLVAWRPFVMLPHVVLVAVGIWVTLLSLQPVVSGHLR